MCGMHVWYVRTALRGFGTTTPLPLLQMLGELHSGVRSQESGFRSQDSDSLGGVGWHWEYRWAPGLVGTDCRIE